MKIPLSACFGPPRAFAIVDECDAYVADFNWQLHKDGYACRTVREDDKRRTLMMHRLLLELEFGNPLEG